MGCFRWPARRVREARLDYSILTSFGRFTMAPVFSKAVSRVGDRSCIATMRAPLGSNPVRLRPSTRTPFKRVATRLSYAESRNGARGGEQISGTRVCGGIPKS
jgi:hypothetical protein